MELQIPLPLPHPPDVNGVPFYRDLPPSWQVLRDRLFSLSPELGLAEGYDPIAVNRHGIYSLAAAYHGSDPITRDLAAQAWGECPDGSVLVAHVLNHREDLRIRAVCDVLAEATLRLPGTSIQADWRALDIRPGNSAYRQNPVSIREHVLCVLGLGYMTVDYLREPQKYRMAMGCRVCELLYPASRKICPQCDGRAEAGDEPTEFPLIPENRLRAGWLEEESRRRVVYIIISQGAEIRGQQALAFQEPSIMRDAARQFLVETESTAYALQAASDLCALITHALEGQRRPILHGDIACRAIRAAAWSLAAHNQFTNPSGCLRDVLKNSADIVRKILPLPVPPPEMT